MHQRLQAKKARSKRTQANISIVHLVDSKIVPTLHKMVKQEDNTPFRLLLVVDMDCWQVRVSGV